MSPLLTIAKREFRSYFDSPLAYVVICLTFFLLGLLGGIAGLLLVFVPQLNIVVGGSARWLKLGPLPAVHPAEFAKLALVVYLAHWFAKRGTAVHGLLSSRTAIQVLSQLLTKLSDGRILDPEETLMRGYGTSRPFS